MRLRMQMENGKAAVVANFSPSGQWLNGGHWAQVLHLACPSRTTPRRRHRHRHQARGLPRRRTRLITAKSGSSQAYFSFHCRLKIMSSKGRVFPTPGIFKKGLEKSKLTVCNNRESIKSKGNFQALPNFRPTLINKATSSWMDWIIASESAGFWSNCTACGE